MPARKTLASMQEIANKHGGNCLSEKYINGSHPLIWKCEKGHCWEERPTITLKTSWCPYCKRRRTRRKTLSEIQQMATEKGGRCLSKSYNNSRQKLLWDCSEGHQWKAKPNTIQQGKWCRICGYIARGQNGVS